MTKPTNEMLCDTLTRKALGRFLVSNRAAADDVAVGDIVEQQLTLSKREVVVRDRPLWNEFAKNYGEFRVPLLGWLIAERTKSSCIWTILGFERLGCAGVLTNQKNARFQVTSTHVTRLRNVFRGVAK